MRLHKLVAVLGSSGELVQAPAHSSCAAQGYSIMDKYPAIKKYFDALAEMPAWKQTLPEGGDKVRGLRGARISAVALAAVV